jgi:hypothetical protein
VVNPENNTNFPELGEFKFLICIYLNTILLLQEIHGLNFRKIYFGVVTKFVGLKLLHECSKIF